MALHHASCASCGTAWIAFNGSHPEPWDEHHELAWCPACPSHPTWRDVTESMVAGWSKLEDA